MTHRRLRIGLVVAAAALVAWAIYLAGSAPAWWGAEPAGADRARSLERRLIHAAQRAPGTARSIRVPWETVNAWLRHRLPAWRRHASDEGSSVLDGARIGAEASLLVVSRRAWGGAASPIVSAGFAVRVHDGELRCRLRRAWIGRLAVPRLVAGLFVDPDRRFPAALPTTGDRRLRIRAVRARPQGLSLEIELAPDAPADR